MTCDFARRFDGQCASLELMATEDRLFESSFRTDEQQSRIRFASLQFQREGDAGKQMPAGPASRQDECPWLSHSRAMLTAR